MVNASKPLYIYVGPQCGCTLLLPLHVFQGGRPGVEVKLGPQAIPGKV